MQVRPDNFINMITKHISSWIVIQNYKHVYKNVYFGPFDVDDNSDLDPWMQTLRTPGVGYYIWQPGIDEPSNILKYIIYGFFIKSTQTWLLMNSFLILFGNFFSFCRSIHWKNHIWLENLVFRTDWNISSQAKRKQPIATPRIDRYVKINRNFLTFERLVIILYTLSC